MPPLTKKPKNARSVAWAQLKEVCEEIEVPAEVHHLARYYVTNASDPARLCLRTAVQMAWHLLRIEVFPDRKHKSCAYTEKAIIRDTNGRLIPPVSLSDARVALREYVRKDIPPPENILSDSGGDGVVEIVKVEGRSIVIKRPYVEKWAMTWSTNDSFLRELAGLRRLHGSGVAVSLLGWSHEYGHSMIAIMMDLFDGGTLYYRLRKTAEASEETKQRWVEMLVDRVYRMHQYGVYHRDLHPCNVLVSTDGERLVLCDFSRARFDSPTHHGSEMTCHTARATHSAPELRATTDRFALFDAAQADVYSLGVMVEEVMCWRALGDGEVLSVPYQSELAAQCLVEDPLERFTAEDAWNFVFV